VRTSDLRQHIAWKSRSCHLLSPLTPAETVCTDRRPPRTHGNADSPVLLHELGEPCFAVGNELILMPIEVLVCRTCGERYYDPKTKRYLEEVEKELEQRNSYSRKSAK
jgi:hypothetical protein